MELLRHVKRQTSTVYRGWSSRAHSGLRSIYSRKDIWNISRGILSRLWYFERRRLFHLISAWNILIIFIINGFIGLIDRITKILEEFKIFLYEIRPITYIYIKLTPFSIGRNYRTLPAAILTYSSRLVHIHTFD